MSATTGPAETANWDHTKKRLVPAVVIGSMLEWYDMFLYAQASALIFGTLFFSDASPVMGTIAAFATFGVGYAARPLGAVIFGHLGDRHGRRSVLVATLIIMGLATALIGLLPTYGQVGILAPILLVTLRLFQGLAAGAELAGAFVMMTEAAPRHRRGLSASLPGLGVYMGVVLASLLGLLASLLPEEALMTWGWRVPFLISIVLVGVGLYIRMKVQESPQFEALARERKQAKLPIVEVFRRDGMRLFLSILAIAPVAAASVIILVYSLSYSVSAGTPRSVALLGSLIGTALAIFTAPLGGYLTDVFGRRRVYLVLVAGTLLWAFPFFALLGTGETGPTIVAHLVVAPFAWAITGAQGAYLAELFRTDVRFSGVALGKEITTALSAPLPVICVALAQTIGGAPWYAAGILAGSCVLGLIALWILPETFPGTWTEKRRGPVPEDRASEVPTQVGS